MPFLSVADRVQLLIGSQAVRILQLEAELEEHRARIAQMQIDLVELEADRRPGA